MAAPALVQDDFANQAAELAAAILRFQEPLAHQLSTHTPAGMPVIGVDAYVFPPSPHHVPRGQIAEYLVALPGSAMLAPTTVRGMISLVLLHELSGERRACLQHELDNHSSALAAHASAPDDDRVLLEFDDESHLFALGAVRLWAQRYGILVGWNMGPCNEPGRAEWQINLLGGDGRRYSKGFGRNRPTQ